MLPAAKKQHCSTSSRRAHRISGSRPLTACRQLQLQYRVPRTHCCAAAGNKELSPKEQQLLQRILNYQYTVDVPEGQLVVSPLREQWLQRTGDLLADTFVDAKGIQPYRRYVRRNIGKYLDQHISMPPAAVLVTAVLRSQVEGSPNVDLGLHDLQPPLPSSVAAAQSSSSSPVAGQQNSSSSSGSSNSSTKSMDEAAAGSTQPSSRNQMQAVQVLTRLLLSTFGWLVKPAETPPTQASTAPIVGSSTSSSSSSDPPAKQSNTTVVPASELSIASSSSSSSQKASNAISDAAAAATAPAAGPAGAASHSSTGPVFAANRNSSSSGSSQESSAKADSPSMASLVGSALQRLSGSVSLPQLRLQQQKVPQMHVVETLVGVAEVSFQERTRSQALTLNPPQHCAYLCNMAVAKAWRRKGVASTLMTAVEDMCLLAGEADLYLHLRFKDASTAGSLYRKQGFVEAKRDCWLLLLVGQEPRFLMLKQLAAARTLIGQVLLPGFQQGVTAAELQQQQDQPQETKPLPETSASNSQQPAAAPAASPAA